MTAEAGPGRGMTFIQVILICVCVCVKDDMKKPLVTEAMKLYIEKRLKPRKIKILSIQTFCETFLPFEWIIQLSDPAVELRYLFKIPFTPEV